MTVANKFQNFLLSKRTAILVFVCILMVYGISWYKRQADYWHWMAERQDYVVDHVTAMMDMDAYYWLKMAQELDEGQLAKGRVESLKGYPDRVPFALHGEPSLLAQFISFGKHFTGGNYYRSGLLLIPILSGLFIFPLFFYFNRLGFGASAVLGGLVGTFSTAYYVRTMVGRVDTDLLNTFFPLLAACFILPISREKSWRANLCLAAGAGLTMYLFTWWYQQPSFILVYLCLLALLPAGQPHPLEAGRAHFAGLPAGVRSGLRDAERAIAADFPVGLFLSAPHGPDRLAEHHVDHHRSSKARLLVHPASAARLFAARFRRPGRIGLPLFATFPENDPRRAAAHPGRLVAGGTQSGSPCTWRL